MSSQQIVDANGAIHSGQDGRFTGHLHGEGDAEQVLGTPTEPVAAVRKSRFPSGEELRRLVAERDAAARAAARLMVEQRLAVIRAAVEGIELPTEPHPSGITRSFEPEEDPNEVIKTMIARVPARQAELAAARADHSALTKALADFPTLPQQAKDAIGEAIVAAEWEIKGGERRLRWAEENRHMYLYEAHCEIERLEAELASGEPSGSEQ